MMGSASKPCPDHREAAMARADLYKLVNYSTKLFKMIQDGDQLEGWVQAKITKSADYIASVYHFMEYEMKFSEYGERLETADMYSESVKREFKRKLTEARVKLNKLKEKNIADLDEGWEDMMAANKKAASEKGTGKFDVKKTSTGTQYTRKSNTFSDGGDKNQKKAKKTDEGIKDMAKKAMGAVKKAGSKALDTLGHGSDEDLIKGMQRKAGMPQTGKKPIAVKQVAKKSQNQGVAEGQLNEFGGGGFPKTPNYKVGDYVMVKGYQGVGKIAYIKHRADVGVIIKEPSPLRVQTTIDKLIPKQGVAEAKNHMGETEYNTYSGWRAACKRAGADQFDGDRDICQALSNGTGVGEWDGVVGTVYDDAHKKSPKQVAKKSQNQGVAEGEHFGGK